MLSLKPSAIAVSLPSTFLFSIASMSKHEIRSPIVTDWGDWGYYSHCEPGMFVKGMKLKVEIKQGDEDDTSLNAIRFLCVRIKAEVDEENILFLPYFIRSNEQDWGNWGQTYQCQNRTYAVGFQLRSESKQGKSGDDTAANNLRLFCSSGEMLEGDGLDWGDWTTPQFCDKGFALCGLRTQVEKFQGGGDDTALNNLKAECCKMEGEIKLGVSGSGYRLAVTTYLNKMAVVLFVVIRLMCEYVFGRVGG